MEIKFEKVLERWAAAKGMSFEWIAVKRPDLLRAGVLARHTDHVFLQVRPGANEGMVVEVHYGRHIILRAKSFNSLAGAWKDGAELTAALTRYRWLSALRKAA